MTARGNPMIEGLARVIKFEREARDITQEHLAKSIGMHPMALSKIERGIQKDVGIITLTKICTGLSLLRRITVGELITKAENVE